MQSKKIFPIRIAIALLIILIVNSAYFTIETTGNLLKGDDWRFLLLFYRKWLDGTFQLKDWFSDHHPIVWDLFVFILNAEIFSLQPVYAAWIGLIIKMIVGALTLWLLIKSNELVASKLLAIMFPIYILLLFFGMNETVEYTWALVTYESSMTYLCAFLVSITQNRLLNSDRASIRELLLALVIALLGLVLMGTLIKLFLIGCIFVLAGVAITERKITKRFVLAILCCFIAIAGHALFLSSLHLPHSNGYAINISDIFQLVNNLNQNFMILSYGIAAGVSSKVIFHYPSIYLSVFAIISTSIAVFSIFVFYQQKMWKITILPAVLVVYMLLSLVGAIVFRANEINLNTWPLYIPRYFPYYHMGWIGVVWIYFYKVREVFNQRTVALVSSFLVVGCCLMLLSILDAWRAKPFIDAANRKAEVAFCRYYLGDLSAEKDIPIWIRGSAFSQEGVRLLHNNKLNIFNEKSSVDCGGVANTEAVN